MSDYTKINEQVIKVWKDKFNFYWMIPFSHEEFESIKNGANLLTVTPNKKVPYEWYSDCKGKKVLGVASGGGQQMAVFSALGAQCTLLDISNEQIESDLLVSRREGYAINVVKGDMTERLPKINPAIAEQTHSVLELNKSERHIRGGKATQLKYKAIE